MASTVSPTRGPVPRLRAGLVGCGVMGQHHARVLQTLPHVDFIGVVEPNEALLRNHPTLKTFSSIGVLASEGVDYCVVAVPTDFHEAVCLELAAHGIHVLVEKPLAPDVASATRIVQAFDDRGLHGAVGHIERYNAALLDARQRIARGDLGNVFQIATRRQGPFPHRVTDVGVTKDLATHDIDLTAWIVGTGYRRVTALTRSQAGRPHEDLLTCLGEMGDGLPVSHLVNWLSPLKERVVTITGESGTLIADLLSSDVTLYANGTEDLSWEGLSRFRGVREGDITRFAISKTEPLLLEHNAFRDLLLGHQVETVSMAEGLLAVRVAEAILQSAELRRTVNLVPADGGPEL